MSHSRSTSPVPTEGWTGHTRFPAEGRSTVRRNNESLVKPLKKHNFTGTLEFHEGCKVTEDMLKRPLNRKQT